MTTPSGEQRALCALITGEEPLSGEFAALCTSRGITPILAADTDLTPDRLGRLKNSEAVRNASFALELTLVNRGAKRLRLAAISSMLPASVPILSASATVSTTEQATWAVNGERLVGISALPSIVNARLMELAPGIQTSHETITSAEDIFIRLGKEISVVQDRVGMVFPRIVCGLINEAFFAMMEGAAEGTEIDTAMKLGTHYPRGPVEWANAIGIANVVAVLDALRLETGEERYRTAPLLRRLSYDPSWWRAGTPRMVE